jgi:glycosyltransferase involved in cell wall biosynthesis
MKVAIIGIIGVSKGYGGFETLAENLIGDGSPITTVYCSSSYFNEKVKRYKDTHLVYVPLNSKGLTKVFHTAFSMFHAGVSRHDQLLLLGVSGGAVLPLIRLCFPRIRIITNIDGLEWKRAKWSFLTRKFLKLSEYLSCKFSHVVIADNAALVEYVEATYGFVPVEIAYGGDQALAGNANSAPQSETFNAFSLCRIVPENNVMMILRAFSLSKKRLTFVGNWNDSGYGLKLKDQYSKFPNIELLDPIFDLSLLYKLRSKCHVYIHGHSVGGTNPALVEMMHFGKPIYAYNCSYNIATLENQGQFFSNAEELGRLLKRDPKSDVNRGHEIKKIASKRYTWEIVRNEYFTLLSDSNT